MAARRPWLAAVVVLTTVGCGRTDRSAAEPPAGSAAKVPIAAHRVATGPQVATSVTTASAASDAGSGGENSPSSAARRLVQRVVERYRQASAYRDDGVVRLAYLQSGTPQADEAPLRVRYESRGRLRLTAYALDLTCDAGRMEARIDGPAAGDLQRQLLRRPLAGPPLQLAELYADPLVVHFASAGLGGPSPQLELLLAPQPLAGLLDGQAKLELGPQRTVDGAACQAVVVVDVQSLRYVLWIDRNTLLVRRIELPLQGVPAAAEKAPIEEPRLTIELVGAAFVSEPQETYRLADAAGAVPVRRFVPRPPPLASELIGQQPQAFELRSTDGAVTVSHRGAGGKTAVLLWVADHEGSRLAAGQLQSVAAGLPDAVRQTTEFVIVMAEPDPLLAAEPMEATGRLLRQWQIQLPWIDDTTAVGRDVFQFSAAPALCVLSPEGRVQWVAHPAGPQLSVILPGLLNDLTAGVDVGGAIRQQHRQAQQTYEKQLREARWDDR